MKPIALAVMISAAAFAQAPSCVVVSQTLYINTATNPSPMEGKITVTRGYSTPPTVAAVAEIVVEAGAVSWCGVPGNYTADYEVQNPAPLISKSKYRRYWTVPSSGPVTIAAIEGTQPATPNTSVGLSWLAQGGAGIGELLTWNGSQWTPTTLADLLGAPPSGTYCLQSINGSISWGTSCGGTQTLTLSSLTNTQLASLTNSQLLSLTN